VTAIRDLNLAFQHASVLLKSFLYPSVFRLIESGDGEVFRGADMLDIAGRQMRYKRDK
jgi:hypothetical protein